MGKKKAARVAHPSARRQSAGKSKYEDLTVLNDKLLTAASQTPLPKDLETSCNSIYELVEQIRILQRSETTSEGQGEGRERKLKKFTSWCNEHGVQNDKVELAMFDGVGVGVKATQKIQHHEMFLSIPRSLMLTADVQTSSIGQLLKSDPIASRMPNIALALYLLSEKFAHSSFWKPYIDALPESYNTPLYFSPSEISLLKGSSVYEESISMQRNIARQYAYFWALFIDQSDKYSLAKHFTYNQYRWAVSTVMTRQNIIPPTTRSPDEPRVGCLALIPFWDMCNHKHGEMLTDYDEDLNECHCYANEVCEPGDQVFICYSLRPNSDFLVHNGFVYDGNINDSVSLRLGLGKAGELLEMRRTILSRCTLQGETLRDSQVFFISKQSPHLPDNLLTFLRVFNATKDELQNLLDGNESGDQIGPISEDNEKKCWTFLKVRCSLLLRAYTTDFTNTDQLSNLNTNHVSMARRQLEGEKAILNNVITLCDEKLAAV